MQRGWDLGVLAGFSQWVTKMREEGEGDRSVYSGVRVGLKYDTITLAIATSLFFLIMASLPTVSNGARPLSMSCAASDGKRAHQLPLPL